MDTRVTIEGNSKSAQTRAEMAAAMASMQQIASSQMASEQFGIPARMESGFASSTTRSTCETREGGAVHQHVDVSGKEMQKYKIPVDADEPVIFACSGEGIEKVSLYVGGTLMSVVRPTTAVQAPDGRTMYMLDFLGKPLRGELIPRNIGVVVEFLIDGDELPTLALLYADTPRCELSGGFYEEPVVAHGDSGPIDLIIVYTPTVVGFRKPD